MLRKARTDPVPSFSAAWDHAGGNHSQSRHLARRSRRGLRPRPSLLPREQRWAPKRQNKYAIHVSPSRPPWNVHNPQTKREVWGRAADRRNLRGGVEVSEKISTNYRRRVFWSMYTTATRMLILKTLIFIWKTRRGEKTPTAYPIYVTPFLSPYFRFAVDISSKSGYFERRGERRWCAEA